MMGLTPENDPKETHMRGTQNINGHGFIVRDVPNFLDQASKARPTAVYKSRKAAERKAFAEADWYAKVGLLDQVEGIVAAQVEGIAGMWFVVYIYTDQTAADIVAREEQKVRLRAAALRLGAERA